MISTLSAGSPGPLESITPSNPPESTVSAGVWAGNTVTSQPRFWRQRIMFSFTP